MEERPHMPLGPLEQVPRSLEDEIHLRELQEQQVSHQAEGEQVNSRKRKHEDDKKGKLEGSEPKRSRDCFRCGGSGHIKVECNSMGAMDESAVVCFKCQGKGHFARDCPNLRGDVCYCCGLLGHHGLDCPSNNKRKGPPSRVRFNRGPSNPYAQTNSYYGGAGYAMYPQGDYSGYFTADGSAYAAAGSMGQWDAAAAYGQQQQTGAQQATFACYRCGDSRHMAKDCPGLSTTTGAPSGYGGYSPQQTGYSATMSAYSGRTAYDLLPSTSTVSAGSASAASAGASNAGGPMQCFRCGGVGHYFRDCRLDEGAMPSRDACYKCGQPGHFSRDCMGPDKRVCFLCHKLGHVAKSCSELAVK